MAESALDRLAELVVDERAAPSAAVAAAVRCEGGWRFGSGRSRASVGDDAPPLFDLASVTKPFVAVLAARLARAGVLTLEDPLGALLPVVAGTASGALPLIAFLSHRAGLEAHRPLYAVLAAGRPVERGALLRRAANARRSDAAGAPPAAGFSPLYSDLGYLLAGAALEEAAGAPLDALVEREVAEPLGLEVRSARVWLQREPRFHARVAPTESVDFRGGEIRGVVHDENAWTFAGHGLAGQAGLFGHAEAVARFGMAVLDASAGRAAAFLSASEIAPLICRRPGGTLRAGFDGKAGEGSAAGELASPETFGHLGFTGTSLWCDPAAERVTVLLSNRVCPTRENTRIRAVRPRIHDALLCWDGGLVTGDQP